MSEISQHFFKLTRYTVFISFSSLNQVFSCLLGRRKSCLGGAEGEDQTVAAEEDHRIQFYQRTTEWNPTSFSHWYKSHRWVGSILIDIDTECFLFFWWIVPVDVILIGINLHFLGKMSTKNELFFLYASIWSCIVCFFVFLYNGN